MPVKTLLQCHWGNPVSRKTLRSLAKRESVRARNLG
jgi:hypothetical protein